MIVNTKINIALTNARKKSGFTQAEIAEKASISLRAYQYIEIDGRSPNVHTAKLIARALNSTVEELF